MPAVWSRPKYSFFLTTAHLYHFKPFLHMDASKFGRSNNGNATPSIEGRYDTTKPTLNLLSTSRNRMNMENERTNKPLDHPSAFSLQLSNLKLSKRLDKNHPISEPVDHTCLYLLPASFEYLFFQISLTKMCFRYFFPLFNLAEVWWPRIYSLKTPTIGFAKPSGFVSAIGSQTARHPWIIH